MDTKRMRHLPGKIVANLALVLILAAGGCLLLSGCKSSSDPQKKSDGGGSASQPAGTGVGPAARSPKEHALAGFLQTMKMEGKPVLIEFGLVGCELSGKGLDSMIALQKVDTVPGLAFVRVEGNSDAAAVDKYFKDKAVPFAVYKDEQSALAKALSATAYPTFLLADKFWHIRYVGKYPQENLVQWGKTLAAEQQDPGGNVPLFGAKEIDVAKLLALELPDLKGDVKPLSAHKAAGGLMLLFVDTACPFCAIALKEMPMVSKALAERQVVAVVVNNDDAKDKVLGFYARNDPGAPVVYDTGPATREQWNVQSVPIVVYITPAGKVGYQGEAIWANMGSAIETSLGLAAGSIKFAAAGTGFG